MLPQYTTHLYSVNSPSSTQANPVFTSGIGTQQQKAQWEGKERSQLGPSSKLLLYTEEERF